MRLKLGFLGAALVFLGACAPTQLGVSPYAPLEMSSDILKSTKLKPGATWYVSRLYNNTYLGISRDDMNSYFNSSTLDQKKGDILRKGLGGYAIADFMAPKDWKVSLASVNARRDVVDISGGYTYFQDAAEVILQVDVPALSTDDGLVRATLRLPNGDTINIGFFATLDVPKPGTAALPASSD